MKNAADWLDLDRLKEHLNFYRDGDGVFVGSDNDLKLADCTAAAAAWAADYTGLPLLRETISVAAAPPAGHDQPLYLPRIVYPVEIAAVRYWPDEGRGAPGTEVQAADVGRMVRVTPTDRAPFVRVWPAAAWPDLGPGGWEVDVTKDVTYQDRGADSIAMAIIQAARDFYDGGQVKERKTAAQALLNPYRYKGTGL